MAYNVLLLSVLILYKWTNVAQAEIPECSTVGGTCEVSCEDAFLMPMPNCAGDRVCCKKSVKPELEIFGRSMELSVGRRRRNGRCKGRRACRKAKGACVRKEHGCGTAVMEGLCKGTNCQCCLKDNCRSRRKKGCDKKGGVCKLKAVGCSADQTEAAGCKGKRCVCCMGPPPPHRPYCGNCGKSTIDPTRIVGGQETDHGEYPWQALMILYEPNGEAGVSFCGGSLIKNKWVLTAAHCFSGITYSGMIVSLGDHNNTDPTEILSETFIYSDVDIPNLVILHPNYDPVTNDNDIALIELKWNADTSRYNIAPICLAAAEDIVVGDKVIVTGWGEVEYAGAQSNVLLEVELDLISVDDCTTKYENLTQYQISDNMICTLTPAKDACRGDSGGPLIRQLPDGRWVQIGIVSFGFQCASPNHPGVFTNVAKYIDWIDDTTGSTEC